MGVYKGSIRVKWVILGNNGVILGLHWDSVVSLNYCSQNGGNLYRAPYYNGNPNIGPRIIGNLDQSPNVSYLAVAGSSKHGF